MSLFLDNPEATTPAHKPGYFSPQKPPKPQKPIINIKPKPPGSTQKPVYVKPKPSTTTQRPSLVTKRTTNPHRPTSTTYRPTERPAKPEQSYQKPSQKPGTVNDPSWQDQSFVDWFFQAKPQKNEPFDGLHKLWILFETFDIILNFILRKWAAKPGFPSKATPSRYNQREIFFACIAGSRQCERVPKGVWRCLRTKVQVSSEYIPDESSDVDSEASTACDEYWP